MSTDIYKTISTKFLGPTDTKGARIVASIDDGRKVTIGYPYELNSACAHKHAAETLCTELGINTKLLQGATKEGYVFLLVPTDAR
jgi:hypothetical protein